jgi:hypothetical protein
METIKVVLLFTFMSWSLLFMIKTFPFKRDD